MIGRLDRREANIAREPQVHTASGSAGAVGGASATAVSLPRAAAEFPVAEQIALRDQALRERDQDLRDWMTRKVIPAFLWTNGVSLVVIVALVVLDEVNAWRSIGVPGDRIITSHVIMTLLGATAVQVGAIAALIARYLFPSRR